MKTDIAYIYALIDPRDQIVRYIGKTVNPKNRLSGHITESKKFTHHRAKWMRNLIENDIRPIFKVLEICPLSDFIYYESKYIQMYKSDKLTNSDETGQGSTGRKREIIYNAAKKISKKVYQFDLDGNYIQEFESTRDAARKMNTLHSHISRCCNKILKHTGGYIYTYQRLSKIEKVSNPNAVKKSVIEIDNNGNIINEWKSIMDCSRDTRIDNGNLSRVCHHKLKNIKGRIFRFK